MTVEESSPVVAADQNTVVEGAEMQDIIPPVEDLSFNLKIKLPRGLGAFDVVANPISLVSDIKSHIVETVNGQFYTCFHLEFNGVKLEDGQDLGSIDGFTPDSVLTMVEEPYTDREMRIHLTRFREIISNFQSTMSTFGYDMAVTYLSTLSGDHDLNPKSAEDETKSVKAAKKQPVKGDKANVFADYDFNVKNSDNLESLIPSNYTGAAVEPCLRSLTVSPWNPPPPQARMSGDLMYLSVTTLEGVSLNISCSVSGFHVNRSTESSFDPSPRSPKPYFSHTLPGLLSMASPLFKTRFANLQASIFHRLPHEYLIPPASKFPWLTRAPTHTADSSRTIDVSLAFADAADVYAARDWNEDLQAARELPRQTPQERVVRDQTIRAQYADFLDAASKGAVNITTGNMQPINPGDPEGSLMFIHGGIFFSHGNDQRESYEKFGGAAAAHVAVSKDVDGVGLLSSLDLEGLHTLGTALVDFKGQRLVAQAIVPGILRRAAPAPAPVDVSAEATEEQTVEDADKAEVVEKKETASTEQPLPEDTTGDSVVVYGSIDGGKTVVSSPVFHELASTAARYLHLEEHEVVDASGKTHKLFTSIDTKGLTGNDGRKYFLDLTRLLPTDIEFAEEVDKEEQEGSAKYPHRMVLMRAELVDQFYEFKLRQFIQEYQEKLKKEDEERKEKGEEAPETKEDAEEIVFDLRYNPDAFALGPASDNRGGEVDSPALQKSKEMIRTMSRFLRNNLLPSIVIDLATNPSSVPLDSEKLTAFFHDRGLNMRYLGKVLQMLEKVPKDSTLEFTKDLLREEVVSRACKTILREQLRDTPLYLARECIAHFFNCLYAANPETNEGFESKVHLFSHPMHAKGSFEWEKATPKSLHERLAAEIESRFRYTFQTPSLSSLVARRRIPLLRSVAMKVGIQLCASNKDFNTPNAAPWTLFKPADILNLYPITKSPTFTSTLASEVFSTAMHSLRQKQVDIGIEMMQESAMICEQVYSPLHAETLKIYKNLGMLMHETGELEKAKSYQRKAVITAERTLGFDNPETLQQYLNLAYFECASGNLELGSVYMHHALKNVEALLSAGTSGEHQPYHHTELAAADTQIAMLIAQQFPDLGVKFHQRALEAYK
ncbi:Intracellular distribution of mitochondria, partial [Chytridiales sp. JEL 0842]